MIIMEKKDYNEDISQYLRDISWFSVPSETEEKELFKRIESGDKEARTEIIERNLRYVVYIAKNFINANETLPISDLIEEGNLGLIEAVNRFDYKLGNKFSTYAKYWIKRYILIAITKKSRIIKLPYHIHNQIYEIRKAVAKFILENGYEPVDEEIAGILKMSIDDVKEIRKHSFDALSLDDTLLYSENNDFDYRGENLNIVGYIEDEMIDKLFYESLMKDIDSCDKLTDRDRYILTHRYNLDDEGVKSTYELSKELNISAERVRQLEISALEKLRRDSLVSKYNLKLSK